MSKKQFIMHKALDLFAKQGFEATSVQQITDYCGISKGAFYLSFKSKDELILALINHFMQQITVDIDYTVKHAAKDEMLYRYFHTTFRAFLEHADFVKLLMKEQTHSINDELFTKLQYYNQKTDQTLLSMIDKVYGDTVHNIKYDLIFTIKGLINGYSSFLIFNRTDFNVDLVSRSLVEKTNVLARNITIPFITEEDAIMFHEVDKKDVSKGDLRHLLTTTINEMEDDSIEKESLILLEDYMETSNYNPAIVKGLLENIKNHPQCKWLCYCLGEYFKLD